MLLYPNRSLCRIIVQGSGSIFFRLDNVVYGLAAALLTLALQILVDTDQDWAPNLPHHYGIHAIGSAVGFAVVFRTTYSWQRYWEAVTQLHLMYSKWEDSYGQLLAFASISIAKNQDKDTPESRAKCGRLAQTCDGALNMFSLLSAYACDKLLHGDNERMHQRLKVGKWRDQITTRRQLRIGEDITGARKLPELNVSRRGSVRLSKDCNAWDAEVYNVSVAPPDELKVVLEGASDKCNVVMYWLIHDLAAASSDLEVAPPIQSRMYQELSNGMLGLNQAAKIADVPFPFPFAQMLTLLLIIFAVFMPIYVVCFTQSLVVGPIVSFTLFEGIWGLNEMAKELETPFGTDINHIPLQDFHERFVDACTDMHRAHEAKMQLENDPTAGGIRRGTERRPSLAATSSPRDFSPHSTAEGLTLPHSVSEGVSPRGRMMSGDDNEGGEMPFAQKPSLSKSRTFSGEALDKIKPNRSGSFLAPPSPRRTSDSFTVRGMNGLAPLKELELLRAMQVNSSKVLDEQLKELTSRMEQHLARISADTRALSEAARTVLMKPSASMSFPEPQGEPPSLSAMTSLLRNSSASLD